MTVESRMGERRHELLDDLVATAERIFLEQDVPPAVAIVAANTLADRLADHWGGQNLTFPRDYRWKLAKVELEIFDRFNGNNYDELIRAYSMTERGLRKLIARVRAKLARQAATQQSDMFAGTPAD